jgi:Flp pilus assembly protein TadG
MAIAAPVLLLLALGILEFGRVWYLENELAGAAQAGAIYGSQNPTDTTGMKTVAANNASDVSSAVDVTGFTTSATWGCECSTAQGTGSVNCAATPSCTYNVVDYVIVTVSATYKPIFAWPGSPQSIALSQTVRMRGAQ